MKAHTTLVALVRSDLRVQGLDSNGEWPPLAKRMAKLAWAFAYRVRKAGAAGPSSLGDDDVMLLCQGADVLEALADCASVFFEGYSPRECVLLLFLLGGEGEGGGGIMPQRCELIVFLFARRPVVGTRTTKSGRAQVAASMM